MAVTYSWVISQLECYPQKDSKQNVVFTVHWRRQAQDGNYTADVYGSQSIALDPAASFTPFNNLTKPQVEKWLVDGMGPNRIAELDAALLANIESQKNPPVVTPAIPWV
jgi:hypothetical protein